MSARAALARAVLATTCLLPGCTLLPPIDLERMITQARFTVWQASPFFADGRVMRTPPAGTLPRDAAELDPPFDADATAAAVPVTAALLAAGRGRFETFCAPCHGIRGDGESVVALNMDLRRPPRIAGPGKQPRTAGRIYEIIDRGYGLMRSYAEDLPTAEERWSVVAYLGALDLSQGADLAQLPEAVRREAEESLR